MLPDDCDAVVARGRWDEPRIFSVIQTAGDVTDAEMEHVFNLGLGMLAVVASDDVYRALDAVRHAGNEAFLVGEIVDGHGRVTIERS
jgi:phosphoribosylformylglycinamidine cyclo-ligase